jgi:hypothetical protein
MASFELPRATSEEYETRQSAIRRLAREAARTISAPADIQTLCKAANVPLADDSYIGQPLAIWLRVLQYLEERDRAGLREFLELVDEALPPDSKARGDSLLELYYGAEDQAQASD